MNSANYPSYYRSYIDAIPENQDPMFLLENGFKETVKSLAMVTEEQANGSYQEGKWSIKEIVQHLIDCERIFCFRALSIARGEKKEIFGFDHDLYAKNSAANKRSLKGLLEEFQRQRHSTIDLFSSFTKEAIAQEGTANGLPIKPEQIQYIIIGHEMHHRRIIEERYL